MGALLRLQLKNLKYAYFIFIIAIILVNLRETLITGYINGFTIFLILTLFSLFSSNSVFLQQAPVREMMLAMPISRRTMIVSSYVFIVGSFLIVSLLTFIVQLYAGIVQEDLFVYLTYFIYAFSISLAFIAFQLYFYFTGNIKSLDTSESLFCFFVSLFSVLIPMLLLAFFLSKYVILLGPLWSAFILWLTFRSATKHFEQKELGL